MWLHGCVLYTVQRKSIVFNMFDTFRMNAYLIPYNSFISCRTCQTVHRKDQ